MESSTLNIRPLIPAIHWTCPWLNIIAMLFSFQDLEKEYQRQAFFQSKMPDGEITAVKFAEIMKVLRGHKLSPFVREYLLTVGTCSFDVHVVYMYVLFYNLNNTFN